MNRIGPESRVAAACGIMVKSKFLNSHENHCYRCLSAKRQKPSEYKA